MRNAESRCPWVIGEGKWQGQRLKGRPDVVNRRTKRSNWSTFSIALIGLLMMTLLAACGGDDEDDSESDAAPTVAATATTASGSSSDVAGTATETDDAATTSTSGDMGDVMAIGACLQEGTTADVVNDLRDGNTGSSEDVYRECLSDSLPPVMVSQLDPIIEQAGECGTEAAAELSDDDIDAIENGDQATIEQVTSDTLDCLSAQLGIELQ